MQKLRDILANHEGELDREAAMDLMAQAMEEIEKEEKEAENKEKEREEAKEDEELEAEKEELKAEEEVFAEEEDEAPEQEKDNAKSILEGSDMDDSRMENKGFVEKIVQKRAEIENAKSFMEEIGVDSQASIQNKIEEAGEFLAMAQGMLLECMANGENPSGLIRAMAMASRMMAELQKCSNILSEIGVGRL